MLAGGKFEIGWTSVGEATPLLVNGARGSERFLRAFDDNAREGTDHAVARGMHSLVLRE